MEDGQTGEHALFPERVGDRLRAARTKAGLDLSDIATKTRVPLRHLTAIESGDYASLPSATYCVGFVKAYARCVGENEVELANSVRLELGQQPREERYEPNLIDEETTGVVPGRKLALIAAAIAALLVAGYFFVRSSGPGTDPQAPVTEAIAGVEPSTEAPLENAATPAAPNPKGQVVLTATDAVWLSIKDASGTTLIFREMKAGESYTVPAEAVTPKIVTGRPEKLKVTIDGKEVAPLGPPERTVKNLDVSAAALSARQPVAPPPTAASSAATTPLPGTTQP